MIRNILFMTLMFFSCTEKAARETTAAKNQGMITLKEATGMRDTNPAIGASELSKVVAGNNLFAIDLYKKLAVKDGNTLFSPYSISVALGMTWAGARGETEKEIARTLHFPFGQDKQHVGMNALDLSIKNSAKSGGFELNIVNQLWGERTYTFLPSYLKLVDVDYGAGIRLLDFRYHTETSRLEINKWVSGQTKDRIKDLIPKDGITDSARLVLTNAIYFKAEWANTFNASRTYDGKFECKAGDTIRTKTMTQVAMFSAVKTRNYQAMDLPYKGYELSMIIIMPESGKMNAIMKSLSPEFIASVDKVLSVENVGVSLPKFKFTATSISLNSILDSLGMHSPFSNSADFSGVDGKKDLFISDVFHKAFVAVDEKGTEAAAATAVILARGGFTGRPIPYYAFNHPFIFLIRDKKTGSILFIGKITDPTKV